MTPPTALQIEQLPVRSLVKAPVAHVAGRVPQHLAIIAGVRQHRLALEAAISGALESGVRQVSISLPKGAMLDELIAFIACNSGSLAEEGVSLAPLGSAIEDVPELAAALAEAAEWTVRAERLRVNIAYNYDGRRELVHAVRRTAGSGAEFRGVSTLPPVDLQIATAGCTRLCDFLLWESAYAELLAIGVEWQNFRDEHFTLALNDFSRRNRKFGALIPK